MKKLFYFSLVVFLMYGCTTTSDVIDEAVREYYTVQDEIKIGDSKEDVLALLELSQSHLKPVSQKPSARFTKDGSVYDIYYVRTGRVPDGQTTDDEFTPYIFENDVLIEIGWDYLGGEKRTSAEVARERVEIWKAEAGATKVSIETEQNTYQSD
ncbi:MAG: DUF3192 domain-containing protein [Candidatus Omnitrophica bacterium]|nr:DUF3192 domain-containing protein [Candidatus Omnitrophota bacterium]